MHRLAFPVACSDDAVGGCRVRTTLASDGPALGHGSARIAAGRVRSASLPLSAVQHRRIEHATGPLHLTVSMRDHAGRLHSLTRCLRAGGVNGIKAC